MPAESTPEVATKVKDVSGGDPDAVLSASDPRTELAKPVGEKDIIGRE